SPTAPTRCTGTWWAGPSWRRGRTPPSRTTRRPATTPATRAPKAGPLPARSRPAGAHQHPDQCPLPVARRVPQAVVAAVPPRFRHHRLRGDGAVHVREQLAPVVGGRLDLDLGVE